MIASPSLETGWWQTHGLPLAGKRCAGGDVSALTASAPIGRMLAAELSTGAVERRDIGNASEPARGTLPATPPDSPPRLPVRALGEYVPGGRVDAMRRLLRGR